MDSVGSILLEALRAAAAQPGELRLYRSGKLPGLFPARTTAHAEAATQAVRDGLIEIARTEARGKTTIEYVRVTPRGVDFVLQRDSPARAMDELRDSLALNAEGMPAWIAELRKEFDTLNQRVADEMTRIGQRLDRLAQHVENVLQKAQDERQTAPAPWTQTALDYLGGRRGMTGQPSCPLPELFGALGARHFDLSIKEFHTGLRRMQADGLLRLLPHIGDGGPPEPEYALPDDGSVLYYAEARDNATA
jgi:DNA-binding PadR family transcriptional regulator